MGATIAGREIISFSKNNFNVPGQFNRYLSRKTETGRILTSIVTIFYMIICHKTKDIGILKSVGISRVAIVQLFLTFAAGVGMVGAGIGAGAGCAFLVKINDMEDWLFERFGWQLWDRTVYAIGEIPNDIKWEVLAVIMAAAVFAALAGAFLPSARASAQRPVEVLQVNQL